MKKKILLLFTVAAAMMTATACLGTKTIDLNDYVSVEFSGYDGYGTAEIIYDMEALEEACTNISASRSGVKKVLEKEEEEWGMTLYDDEDIDYIVNNIDAASYIAAILYDATLDTDSELTTDDEVTLTWSISEEDIERIEGYFGISLRYDDVTYTVEGLGTATGYDPFEEMEVEYSGISGNAYICITEPDGYEDLIVYSCEPEDDLSNGDTITVTATATNGLAEKGIVLSETETEITVEGLAEYVTTYSDIPEETLEKMKEQAENVQKADAAQYDWKNWEEGESEFVDMEYIGCYFLIHKSGDDYYTTENEIVLVYEITAWNDSVGDLSYYEAYTYDDLILLADGTCSVDLDECTMVKNQIWDNNHSYYYYGYETLDSLFRNQVTAYIDCYDYEEMMDE